MKWLFIIDPIEKLNTETDTTYPVIRESHHRNIDTFTATIQDLFFNDSLKISAQKIEFNDSLRIVEKDVYSIDDFDLIFMRKDPPYDMEYHYTLCLLSIANKPVVNSPQALRDFNEKLIILNFPEFIPKTLVSADEDKIYNFINEHNDTVVIKALDSYQGKIIERLHPNDKELNEAVSRFTEHGTYSVMVQEYLPNIINGDKRILVLGEKILGAVNRMPKENSYLSNFGQGGTGYKTRVTSDEKRMIEKLIPFFLEHGISLAGLDVIDGYLTEINITCPTGLQHINKLENKKLETEVVDYYTKFIR